jgi:lipopolysaccharide/colanic/teichoic acid biosynthesis glycosyltransferase
VITLRETSSAVLGSLSLFKAAGPEPPTSVPLNRRRQTQESRGTCADRHGRWHMMSAEMFRGVLIRERKRADRSSDCFVLMLVDVSEIAGAVGSRAVGNAAIDAVASAKRETDVMGWFEDQSVIGLIVPQLGEGNSFPAADLEQRVRGELVRRLDSAMVNQILLNVYVHTQKKEMNDFGRIDPLLGDFRAQSQAARLNDTFKRTLDIVGSLILLIMLSPLMLIIAALVKATSRGPVLFKQNRIGQRGEPFQMLKFRSMRVNASADIHQQYVTQFIKAGAAAQAGAPGVYKLTNDPRITPIGNFIRKTSIDELPQFLNVLGGSMSLVGPRPPLKYEVEQYKSWHCRRVFEAKPGITGLWQVEGRSRTTFDEMVRLDLRYARSQSIWTDLKILLATPRAVIAGKGAC